MSLTEMEKLAGRAFRNARSAALDALHAADPPYAVVPPFIAIYRHSCAKRQWRSTALELKENYTLSPAYRIFQDRDHELVVEEGAEIELPSWVAHSHVYTVPAGRFAFIYKEGRCRICGVTARSTPGRLVDAVERPPLTGRARS